MARMKDFYDAQARAAGFRGSDTPALDRIGGKRSSRPSSRAFSRAIGRTFADLRAASLQRARNIRAGLDSPGVLALPSRKAWKRMNAPEAPEPERERERPHAKPSRAVRRHAARLARKSGGTK